ncbi:MAG: hypothetical protein ACJ74Z_15055 [Bryobacteraceae bacterium]
MQKRGIGRGRWYKSYARTGPPSFNHATNLTASATCQVSPLDLRSAGRSVVHDDVEQFDLNMGDRDPRRRNEISVLGSYRHLLPDVIIARHLSMLGKPQIQASSADVAHGNS